MAATKTSKKTASTKTSKKAASTSSRRKLAGKAAKSRKSTKAASPTILLVNMIPRSLSGEEHQDSEPSIAVNPANPLQIAGSAFTPDPGEGPLGPIYVSTDGGNTWTLNSILPGATAGFGTFDVTLQFGTKTNVLYAGILRADAPGNTTRLNILRTKDFAGATPMTLLVDRLGVDQPYVMAATVTTGADAGKDRVYVGNNDFKAPGGRT